jgi:menaquinone-9 beta-reductase
VIRTADVLVIGAGPAGSTVARQLARRGHRVTVVDRATFPRPKPCGECLNPGAVAALDRLGLLDEVMAGAPAGIRGWTLRNERGGVATGSYSNRAALGIERTTFDAALVGAARRSGVTVVENQRIATITRAGAGWTATSRNRNGRVTEWRAPILVGADGLRSIVVRQLGLLARAPRVRKTSVTFRLAGTGPDRSRGHLQVLDGKTVGLAPVHDAHPLWNCTVVVNAAAQAQDAVRHPADYVRRLLEDDPTWTRAPAVMAGPWTSGPFDTPTRHIAVDGAVLIGDAAGYFDPLTGQGIFRALRSAELAAEFIHRAVTLDDTSTRILAGYARRYRREVFAPERIQKLIDAALRRSWTRDLAVRRLAHAQEFMDRIVAVAGDVLPVSALWRLDLLLRAA